LTKFVKDLPAEQVKNHHWNSGDQERRFATWYEDNAVKNYSSQEKPPMSRFFQENNTELFEVDCDGENFEMFESMRIYIERDGRPYNYLKSVGELNRKRDEHLKEEEHEWRDNLKKDEEAKLKIANDQKKKLEDLAHARLQQIIVHMSELKTCDKLNMRQFLMKFIIPVLTEGMIEACKVGPLDPVDYLAEYIFKRSSEFREVKN
jgi:adenylate kinase